MRNLTLAALAACLLGLLLALPGRACKMQMAPDPLAVRLAKAQSVVLGQVMAIEDNPVFLRPSPGAEKQQYQVAVIRIKEALLGAEGVTHIRVAYLGGPVWPLSTGETVQSTRQVPFLLGQEVCLFLNRHQDEPVYVPIGEWRGEILGPQNNVNFGAEMDQLRKAAGWLRDPMAGLKSKDAGERLRTAALLSSRYRANPTNLPVRAEPIDAEESRLILETLAEADWDKAIPDTNWNSANVWQFLNLADAAGWQSRNFKDGNELQTAAKEWLKKNAATHRIQRLVPQRTAG